MRHAIGSGGVLGAVALMVLVGGCLSGETTTGSQRGSLTQRADRVDLASLSAADFASPVPVVEAPWGLAEGSYQRELVAAQTGPMAIASELDEGFAVVDTVGARVYRYDPDGALRAVVATGLETVDDIALLPDDSIALLAYRRSPTPGYDLLTFDGGGALRSRRATPQAASLPTALIADGARLFVEQRHERLLAASGGGSGSQTLWGRPVGDLLVRARLDEGDLVLWTTDRTGQPSWDLRIEAPWPVTELLALESAEPFMAVVLRHIETNAEGEPVGHQTWLVTVSHEGEGLGMLRLADSRVTDAGQPVALTPSGDVLELVTDEEGVTILRYELLGGAS